MTKATIQHYIKNIEADLQRGNATEHTHRPALKAMLEALDLGIQATNEPKQIACGAPDYVIHRGELIIGYIEAKDVGISLNATERSDQLKRYRRSLDNLILTDYVEFRWYVDGEFRQEARLGRVEGGRIKADRQGIEGVLEMLDLFLNHTPELITTPYNLAVKMARLTHMIRDMIVAAFDNENPSDLLAGWRDAFARVLIADLDLPENTSDFADMFAQTLAYGLFTARVMDDTPEDFSRAEAQRLIPKSNPFLRDFFYQITGPKMDEEPFAPFVDALVDVLRYTDMPAILADFGRRTRQEDPIVHFYETFLAAYDPKLRESRGVYYTPEPVVSYIVRSVDHLLKTRFGCREGLADSTKITIPNPDPSNTVKGKKTPRKTTESHKVLILDPATGTGTFLYAVIDHIRQQFIDQGNAGMWPGYVKNHLLPRLFGFELLMAPYAVAHFKLTMQLSGRDMPEEERGAWTYDFDSSERLGIYLTNALEEAHEMTGLPLFTQWVADETNEANRVKKHLPILVMIGNPPYSVSSTNKGDFIEGLMDSYKKAVRSERNIQPLSDDYIKFIRFAQDRIDRTGHGVIGIITNHAYLNGLIHRGMREELMKSFSDIYILNLHGNSLIGETAPDGSLDQNVFDIQQGVAITLFVKDKDSDELADVKYADFWGGRDTKYQQLLDKKIDTTTWEELRPKAPNYFFVPKDFDLSNEYEAMPSTASIFDLYSTGFATHRDRFVTGFSLEGLRERIGRFRNPDYTDEEIKQSFNLRDTRDWKLSPARQALRQDKDWQNYFTQCLYRPFDMRDIFYTSHIVEYPRLPVMQHLQHPNFALVTSRIIKGEEPNHICATKHPTEKIFLSPKTSNNAYVFPLYLYPTEESTRQRSLLEADSSVAGPGGRVPNLSMEFVQDIAGRIGLQFIPDGQGDLQETFGPEDIFNYMYAVFHSPTYRDRYAEFLKIDFPRVPLTSDVDLFRTLCALGAELVALHLLESPKVDQYITRYPEAGANEVISRHPRYVPPEGDDPGRVYINKTQHFEGIPPEVWEFYIGGYQVCEKWLKDRKGRQLIQSELEHYQRVVVALQETIRLMDKIDAAIPAWPIE